jgi:hypothetical protein
MHKAIVRPSVFPTSLNRPPVCAEDILAEYFGLQKPELDVFRLGVTFEEFVLLASDAGKALKSGRRFCRRCGWELPPGQALVHDLCACPPRRPSR